MPGVQNLKNAENKTTWFFVDEGGDTTFYDRHGNYIVGNEGCSPILIMGFVSTNEPKGIRASLDSLRNKLLAEPYLQGISSLKNLQTGFHAKDDCPEVRQAFFKLIASLNIKSQIVVARKNLHVFKLFKGNTNALYDHLITVLFKDKLHTSAENRIYFAVRGNRKRQEPLEKAIHKSKEAFEEKWGTKIENQTKVFAQTPSDKPCLQIIDYINWAVYRAYTKNEMRYFNAVREKVSLLVDLYDTSKPNWGNFYDRRKNPFDIDKASPL